MSVTRGNHTDLFQEQVPLSVGKQGACVCVCEFVQNGLVSQRSWRSQRRGFGPASQSTTCSDASLRFPVWNAGGGRPAFTIRDGQACLDGCGGVRWSMQVRFFPFGFRRDRRCAAINKPPATLHRFFGSPGPAPRGRGELQAGAGEGAPERIAMPLCSSAGFSVCQSVSLSVCLSVCLYVCLPV